MGSDPPVLPRPSPWSYRGLRFAERGAEARMSARLHDEDGVFRVIPRGFQACARILHPPYVAVADGEQPSVFAPCDVRWAAGVQSSLIYMRETRWSEIAAANGRVAHPRMEWAAITGDWAFRYGHGSQPGLWDIAPTRGNLDQGPTIRLCELLGGWTRTPGRCCFGVTFIYGDLPEYVIRGAPSINDLYLLAGPLNALPGISFDDRRYRSPNIWWPADHAWCLVSNYDLQESFVAASEACIERLVAEPALEVMRVDPEQPRSDHINPEPRGDYQG